MKNAIFTYLTPFFLILLLLSTDLSALQLNSSGDPEDRRKADLGELREFKRSLDQFSYLMMTGDIAQARAAKFSILQLMDQEIDQKYERLGIPVYSNDRVLRRDRLRDPLMDLSWEESMLLRWLIRQEELRDQFARSELEAGRLSGRMERRHREIMYDFRRVMSEEVQMNNGNRDQQARTVRW